MQAFEKFVGMLGNFAWGPLMVSLLVGTGLLLTVGTKFLQFRKLGLAFKLLFTSRATTKDGDISPFTALMTSLAATIGTGNIAGVATAITMGGPGAVFWMWVTASVGGATKYAEAVLAILYRETNANGEKSGGPMFYIKNGMGPGWAWLGGAFAFFGLIACFGPGTLVQANSVAQVVHDSWGVSTWITGLIVAGATGLVLIGGIKSIGKVADKIVPIMSLVYVVGAITILALNYDKIPHAFGMIFSTAFSGHAVQGGLLGSVVRFGVSRGVFSNEAGLGTAAIVHGAASTTDPVKQGIIGSLGSFIDTLIVCSMTALVILVSPFVNIGADGIMQLTGSDGMMYPVTMKAELAEQGIELLTGAALTSNAFKMLLPGPGDLVILFGLIFFAYSTILGWYYYGSKCLEYFIGVKGELYYKWAWVIACFVGAVTNLEIVWSISDAFNGLMILPNLIGMLALSPVVFRLTKNYDFKKMISLDPEMLKK
ncbi:alanine or glycine:cation symporter, AGCS family [Desulfonispora thiosulfatigenes DSM 11270]|uniref:Alanine or glycine:cation symporter, AGCS family n=1 Tax=Desulfonispora thiosulfatigenes DSM 11270 TaxID=656914 RepID=A0A1W1V1T7_DESTI|nr:sodium:alanine symporter family protein [Desulfonispora thiosulfatigenes]SMB87285.1 alanine or glycine:cation symporter, AGCS family [Desulfonispora thiosulfatigenes DSM 11270]